MSDGEMIVRAPSERHRLRYRRMAHAVFTSEPANHSRFAQYFAHNREPSGGRYRSLTRAEIIARQHAAAHVAVQAAFNLSAWRDESWHLYHCHTAFVAP